MTSLARAQSVSHVANYADTITRESARVGDLVEMPQEFVTVAVPVNAMRDEVQAAFWFLATWRFMSYTLV